MGEWKRETDKLRHRRQHHSYFAKKVHERWKQTIQRTETGDWQPQCYNCVYYIGLYGRLGADWGVCACEGSTRDGHVVFEHDGCDLHEETTDAI